MKTYEEKIKSLIKESELPSDTKFKGYIVNRLEGDKFLHKLNDVYQGVRVQTVWIDIPDEALVFTEREEAINAINEVIEIIEECNKDNLILCLLLETGKQFLVTEEAEIISLID